MAITIMTPKAWVNTKNTGVLAWKIALDQQVNTAFLPNLAMVIKPSTASAKAMVIAKEM